MAKSWVADKKDYMRLMFGGYMEQFKAGDYKDDRRVFVNVYEKIMEALDTLDENPINYVCVAMNRVMEDDIQMMERILAEFNLR